MLRLTELIFIENRAAESAENGQALSHRAGGKS